MREIATEHGEAFDPAAPLTMHRWATSVFPAGARLIQNPYNKIPGFSCDGHGGWHCAFCLISAVMAWPVESVLTTTAPGSGRALAGALGGGDDGGCAHAADGGD
jgi:molybdopterin-biosynthesis enzyme MoeA-like protein